MRKLLEVWAGPNQVTLLGDPYSGGLKVRINGASTTLERDNAQLLAEELHAFLEQTAACPRCGHARIEHFRLFTQAGYLMGCSHGTGEGYQLASGLPCDCPGTSS